MNKEFNLVIELYMSEKLPSYSTITEILLDSIFDYYY